MGGVRGRARGGVARVSYDCSCFHGVCMHFYFFFSLSLSSQHLVNSSIGGFMLRKTCWNVSSGNSVLANFAFKYKFECSRSIQLVAPRSLTKQRRFNFLNKV